MANTDFSILLQAIIDQAGLQSEAQKVQKIFDKYKVKLEPEFNKASLSNTFKALSQDMANALNTALGTNLTGDDVFKIYEQHAQKMANETRKAAREAQNLVNQVKNIGTAMGSGGKTATDIEVLRNNFTKLGLSADQVKVKMDGLDKEVAQLQTLMSNGASNQAIVAQWQQVLNALSQTQNVLKQTRSEYSLLVSDQQRLNLANSMEKFLVKNPNITKESQADIQAYITSLRQLNTQMSQMQFDKMKQGFSKIETSMRGLGRLGASVKQQLMQAAEAFSYYFSARYLVMELVQVIQQVPEEIKKIDSAMIELTKVSDASLSQVKSDFAEFAEIAKRLGASVSDVINATADWSRLGYSLPDSKKLAEIAVLYKNVGDGIDIDTANKSLVSTLQGFQLDVSEAMGIVDKFNEVANNFPIDSAGIGEALQRSASSFYAANTDLSKSIALITGTNAVVQDPEMVGTMWKTATMRIRGAKAELEAAGLETEGMVESTSKLRDLVMGITGFDIMKDEDTFKDMYDIIMGIGENWNDIKDIDQAALLEAISGKRQGNAMSAALSNIDMIKEAYDTATNSAGSALEEQENYEQGIQYSLDRLTASFQSFSQNFVGSGLVKGIVDFGNTFVTVLDKITTSVGALGTIGLGAGLFAGIKNFGGHKILEPHKTIVLKLPNIISVLWDTKVFLWSNVKYTG